MIPPSPPALARMIALTLMVLPAGCGRTDAGKGSDRPAAPPPASAPDPDRCTADADCRLSPMIPRGEARSDEDFCCAGTCPVMRAYTARRLETIDTEYRQRCPRGHVGCPKTDCLPPPAGVARCVAGACRVERGKGG